jgi:CspA family cold shock protein
MTYGKVKWFDGRKDGTGDVFVHYGDIAGDGYRSLNEGERVKFEITQSPKGPKASNVELA